MLKSIIIENFYSINEQQEMSFEVLKKDILDDSARLINTKTGINLVSCFIGPNASGKTNILKALTFLMWFIENSYSEIKDDDSTGAEPFKLNSKKPSIIEIEFFNQKELYKYRIGLTSKKVLSEYLGKKGERGFSRIFEYDIRSDDNWNLQAPKLDINKADYERFRSRVNVALLSCLIDTKYLPNIHFFKDGTSNVTNIGLHAQNPIHRFFETSENLFKNQTLKENVFSFIKHIDLGISDFNFKEVTLRKKDKPSEEKKTHVLECIHKTEKSSFNLELLEESNGTQIGIALLSQIFPVLEKGKIAIFDEIESHLHPDVVKKIISLFENKETNPNNAQLLFSTHQHLLLNDRTKTQIFIAEKNAKSLETDVYRLDDIEGIRNDENYFHKYIAGAYGGTPNIKWS